VVELVGSDFTSNGFLTLSRAALPFPLRAFLAAFTGASEMQDASDVLDEDDLDDRDDGLAFEVHISAMDSGEGVTGGLVEQMSSCFGMVMERRLGGADVVGTDVVWGMSAGVDDAILSETICKANFAATSSFDLRIASAKVFCLRARCIMEAWLRLSFPPSTAMSCRRSALRKMLIARREWSSCLWAKKFSRIKV
jgi:hypothetical protein